MQRTHTGFSLIHPRRNVWECLFLNCLSFYKKSWRNFFKKRKKLCMYVYPELTLRKDGWRTIFCLIYKGFFSSNKNLLEGMTSYAGQLLAPGEGFGLWPKLSGKKGLIMRFWPILGHFWCSVVTFITFSSNLNNFEKIVEQFCQLRRLVFDQSSPVNPVSESRGGVPWALQTEGEGGRKFLCLILDYLA